VIVPNQSFSPKASDPAIPCLSCKYASVTDIHSDLNGLYLYVHLPFDVFLLSTG
jgi:hypothetical protein